MAGLKAFFIISIFMGLKKQPNMKTYWQRKGYFIHSPVISQIFTRDRHQQITKCLHVSNSVTYVTDRKEPGYEKMGQVHWLVDIIREAYMRDWMLGKYITMDEMMINYKDNYCLARQYMPKKPQKWGIKVWCLAYSISKYVYNFDIYCGKVENIGGGDVPVERGDKSMA
jgi:hypothetical protein